MPAGAGGMAATMGGAPNQPRRRGGALHPTGFGKVPKSTKKKGRTKHNRGFNIYGMAGGKGTSMQSKRRGKRPFSPAKARNIG